MSKYPQTLLEVDLETSGLDPLRHGILEAAFHHPASGERFACLVDPRFTIARGEVIETHVDAEPAALRVNGCTARGALDRFGRLTLDLFARELFAWIERVIPTGSIVIAGRNPGFDWSFLERAVYFGLDTFDRAAFLARFAHRKLDTHAAVMALAIARGWKFDAERIDDLYRSLGLEPEQRPHTAERGVEHLHRGLEAIVAEIRAGDHACRASLCYRDALQRIAKNRRGVTTGELRTIAREALGLLEG